MLSGDTAPPLPARNEQTRVNLGAVTVMTRAAGHLRTLNLVGENDRPRECEQTDRLIAVREHHDDTGQPPAAGGRGGAECDTRLPRPGATAAEMDRRVCGVLALLSAGVCLAAAQVQTALFRGGGAGVPAAPVRLEVLAPSRLVCALWCGAGGPLEACDGVTHHPNGSCWLYSGAAGADLVPGHDTELRTLVRIQPAAGELQSPTKARRHQRRTALTLSDTGRGIQPRRVATIHVPSRKNRNLGYMTF